MVFENEDSKVTYINSQLTELGNQSNYLYRKMRGGKPGLFLTGTIPRQDTTQQVRYIHVRYIERTTFQGYKEAQYLANLLTDESRK
jgi:hypothetical protein